MKKGHHFFESIGYLVLLSTLTLIVWSFHWEEYGVIAVLAMMFLLFVFSRDTMPTVPLLMNGLFMVSQTNWSFAEAPLFLYLTPITIIVGMVVHIIKYKVNIFRGKMLLGIGIMVIAMMLSTINAEEVTIYYLFYISIGLLYVFIYLFYRNTFDRNHINFLMKMMAVLGVLIVAEMVVYFVRVDDLYLALQNKTINLGWGISNYVATYLIMFVAISFYYVKVSKHTFFWLFLSMIEIIAIAFTGSRGGMVAMVVMLPILIVSLLWKSKKKLIIFLMSFVLMDFIFVIAFLYKDAVVSLFFRFENLLFDDTGRFEIYQDAIAKFLEHPIFGSGLFARVGDKDYTMFHNMFLHTAATLGIIGLLGLFEQLRVQAVLFLKKTNVAILFLGLSLLGGYVHGMVDNVYFMPQFMVMMLIIVSVVENEKRMFVVEELNGSNCHHVSEYQVNDTKVDSR